MKTGMVRHNGFSLTEALIAMGVLAIGLVMIAMAFPVGVKLASVSAERPIGATAANEAFVKMRLYGINSFTDLTWPANSDSDPATTVDNTCTDFEAVCATTFPANERYYPSLVPLKEEEKRYCWSALLRRADPNSNDVQATVFVCRMMGMGLKYYTPAGGINGQWPVQVKVTVNYTVVGKMITVQTNAQFNALTASRFFTEGCMIVEDKTGFIYKVMETRDLSPKDGVRETLILNNDFPNRGIAGAGFPSSGNADVWVVPPAIGSSRNPCIDVPQTTLIFP